MLVGWSLRGKGRAAAKCIKTETQRRPGRAKRAPCPLARPRSPVLSGFLADSGAKRASGIGSLIDAPRLRGAGAFPAGKEDLAGRIFVT